MSEKGSNPATAWVVLASLVLLAAPARAQELYALFGGQNTKALSEQTYSYSMAYQHHLSDHAFVSYTWLNEGHVSNHHRDGYSVQLWLRELTPGRRFAFAAGIGPYRFYDTTLLRGREESTDLHGFGVLGSAAAYWYFRAPWVATLRYNYAYTRTSITTRTYEIGMGYQFETAGRPGPTVPPGSYDFAWPERNELTVMIGQSIVNDFHSPTGAAWALEYRRRLTPYVDVTVAGVDEGDTGVVKRRGIAPEIWISREFAGHRGTVGLGFGPYMTHDDNETGSQNRILGLLTMKLGCRFAGRWSGDAYWYRTVTTNGRDTDVLLVGLGYAF